MQEVLRTLGFNENEATAYLYLLESAPKTASEIAGALKLTRTNTYMVLERLSQNGVVIEDEANAVRRYAAADPMVLRSKLVEQQEVLKKTNKLLSQSLPKLQSLYNLGQLKPGVVYLEGLDGLRVMLDDMARCKEDAVIIPSQHSPNIPEVWKILQDGVNNRAKLGLKSRIIFPESVRRSLEVDRLLGQSMAIRFWGSKEYPGEIVVYGNKCVFTTYAPSIINTILTNEVIATTLRDVFEDIWSQAKE